MLMSFVFVVVVMAVFIVAWPESRWIVGKGATVPCGFTAIENLLDQLAMELAVTDPHLGIELAIEVLTAIDPGLFAACADRKWRAIPEDKVSVFSDFQRADAVVDTQLLGRVQGYKLQGGVWIESSVLDGFGCFVVHVPTEFGVIGIERHDDPLVMHQSTVVGNRVVDLEFVGPPVREGRSGRTVLGDRIGHFVAFENVLKRSDLDAELIADANQCQDLVLAIAVAMDPPFATKDFGDGFEFKIPAGWESFVRGRPSFPVAVVFFGGQESASEDLFDTHPGLRVSGSVHIGPVALLDVFPQGEFDTCRGRLELKVFVSVSPSEFDDLILSTDRIGRTVKDIGGRQAACELSVERDVFGIDKVPDTNLGGDGLGSLVDTAIGGHVGVAVDETRADFELGSIDDGRTGGYLKIDADGFDLPLPNDHVRIAKDSLGSTGPDGCILDDQQVGLFGGRFESQRGKRIAKGREDGVGIFFVALLLGRLLGVSFSIRFGLGG